MDEILQFIDLFFHLIPGTILSILIMPIINKKFKNYFLVIIQCYFFIPI